MSERYILPEQGGNPTLQIISPSDIVALGTSRGGKPSNEDRIGYVQVPKGDRICTADGHWGDKASATIIRHWVNPDMPFPTSRQQAVRTVKQIEEGLYLDTGNPHMDASKDRPPEASFVAMELGKHVLRVVGYGDCRLLVARLIDGVPRPYYEHAKLASWLGAFSMLGLRDRVPVTQGTVYAQLPVKAGDTVIAYTDGLDECKYETPTIPIDEIMQQACVQTPKSAVESLIQLALDRGGEDNVSVAVMRVS
ncbi:MAG TPA: hypothetical protein VFT53_06490 [Candidatus Saccharimonadales bacterium]|nr:hypothetical protein [Candidatus Saccharimonadales bacterium]